MIRLSTFGKIDLRNSHGRSITSVLSQPRRLALLIFLGTEGRGRMVRRDVLLGVFWPEQPQEKARHALSQAIHFLKRALGSDLITGQNSDEVGLSPAGFSCDAWDFIEAIEAGNYHAALQLYQGDFLPGFFVDSAPDFEQWMEQKRATFRRQAEDGAWQLAVSEELNGTPVAAAAWGRRSSELSNGDEVALRRLIALLGRLGDRAGARQAYQNFASRLHEELGIEPSDETRAALEQVESGSWTTPARVAEASRAPAETPDSENTTRPDPPIEASREVVELQRARIWRVLDAQALRPGSRKDRLLTAALSVAFFLMFGSLWGVARYQVTDGAGKVRLLVHSAQSASSESRDLGEALTAEITGRLERLDSVEVLTQYHDRPYEIEKPNSHSPESYVLRTSILQTPERTRVNAVLIEPALGSALGRVVLDVPSTQLTAVVDSAANLISAFTRKQLGREMRELRWRRERSTPASRSYVRQAVRQREYADSLRKRAAIPAAIAGYRAADSLLILAAEEAPNWNEPTIQRGETDLKLMWAYLAPSNLSLTEARFALARGYGHAHSATEAERSDAAAWELRGVIGYWLWLTAPADSAFGAQQQQTRAELDLRKATLIDNARPRAWSSLAAILESRGSFSEANFAARRAYESDSFLEDAGNTLIRLFATSLEMEDRASAERWCSELKLVHPDYWISDYCQLTLVAWKSHVDGDDILAARRIIHESASSGRADKVILSRFDMISAVVAARAGHVGSANTIAARARTESRGDPEIAQLEAWYLLGVGRKAEAIQLLASYASTSRRQLTNVLSSRRFREISNHPSVAVLDARSAGSRLVATP